MMNRNSQTVRSMTPRASLARSLACLAVMLLSVGMISCGPAKPSYRPIEVRVAVDPGWAAAGDVASLEVDLIAANEATGQQLEQAPLSRYFSLDSDLRQDKARRTFQFSATDTNAKTLSRNDDIWSRWLDTGATRLFVLTGVPFGVADRPGSADPRRLILPLDSRRWKGVDTVDVQVQRSGLVLLTAPLPIEAD